MVRDAVIVDVEFRMESVYEPFGHFICLRFVDESPSLFKLSSFIKELSQFQDVKLVDYNYEIEPITERTNLDVFDELDRLEIEFDQIGLMDSTAIVKWDCPNFFELTDRKFVGSRDYDNLRWVHESIKGYKDVFNGYNLVLFLFK